MNRRNWARLITAALALVSAGCGHMKNSQTAKTRQDAQFMKAPGCDKNLLESPDGARGILSASVTRDYTGNPDDFAVIVDAALVEAPLPKGLSVYTLVGAGDDRSKDERKLMKGVKILEFGRALTVEALYVAPTTNVGTPTGAETRTQIVKRLAVTQDTPKTTVVVSYKKQGVFKSSFDKETKTIQAPSDTGQPSTSPGGMGGYNHIIFSAMVKKGVVGTDSKLPTDPKPSTVDYQNSAERPEIKEGEKSLTLDIAPDADRLPNEKSVLYVEFHKPNAKPPVSRICVMPDKAAGGKITIGTDEVPVGDQILDVQRLYFRQFEMKDDKKGLVHVQTGAGFRTFMNKVAPQKPTK